MNASFTRTFRFQGKASAEFSLSTSSNPLNHVNVSGIGTVIGSSTKACRLNGRRHAYADCPNEVYILMKRLLIAPVLILMMARMDGQQDATGVTFSTDVHLVILDVSVKDKSGKVMPDLKKSDFTVLEDGKAAADFGLRIPEARFRRAASAGARH